MDFGYYNMDCMDGMKEFPDGYFDLAIVDPPYGIGENGDKNHTRGKLAKAKDYKSFSGMDINPPNEKYFDELFRVSKNQIIWGANHFISKMPFDSSCWIVWDKDNGNTDFSDCELAWTSFSTAVTETKGCMQATLQHSEEMRKCPCLRWHRLPDAVRQITAHMSMSGKNLIRKCIGNARST